MRHRSMLPALAVAALLVSCSSSGPSSDSSTTARSNATADAAVQRYLDSVNALCDALLPKVVAVTNGGGFDIPLADFFKQLPEHARLRAQFDRDLARISIPSAAQDKARALAKYIEFANTLDARRLKAARAGETAYRREIEAEKKDAVGDPSIAARTAAGFHDSCNAR